MGSRGSTPKVQPYQAPPQANDPALEAALEKEKILARKKGRQSTILSDQSSDGSNDMQKKTLLGS